MKKIPEKNTPKESKKKSVKSKENSQEFLFEPKTIPKSSGCYLFRDKNDEIIYVGKAKNLKSRVSSYFQKNKKSPKTESLVKKITSIETRTVNSEMEALILENNLIKEHQPKYNILLRDDKNFLYLRITKESLPKMEITRRLVRDGSTYIGPRTSAKSFRNTIAFCQKFFGVKMVNPANDNYVAKMKGIETTDDEYRENIKRMIRFLRGNTTDILKELTKKMMRHAEEKNFEAAAKTRDLIQSISGSTQKQTVELPDNTPRDFIHYVRDEKHTFFVRLIFRDGKFINQNEVLLKTAEFHEDEEILRNFLIQFYPRVDELPAEIILPIEIEGAEEVAVLLQEKSQEKNVSLKIKHAQKGDKARVLEIAEKNAQHMADKHRINTMSHAETFLQALPDLTERLGMKDAPERIECFDISHFAGQETVASQVVFINGEKKSSEYRRYKIQTLESGEIDDFKSMEEVIERRFTKNPSISLSGEEKKIPEICKKEFCFEILKTRKEQESGFIKQQDLWESEGVKRSESKDTYFVKNKCFWIQVLDKKETIAVMRAKKQTKTNWEITSLVVKREFRNRDIGQGILKEFEKFLLENEGKKILVYADKKVGKFYEKNGFVEIDSSAKKHQKYITEMLEIYGVECILMEYKIPKPEKESKRFPDLIVIDGGKGQLSSVLSVFEKNVSICPEGFDPQTQIIALAKREEEVFRGSGFEQLDIPLNCPASKLLQRIRDEAHRFAITYNKNLRKKALTKSILDEISGIGGTTKKNLLQTFGSIGGIREASDEQLLEIVNTKQLENLRKNL